MLAYLITLEDDDGTLLATSPAGPAVSQPTGLRKGRSAPAGSTPLNLRSGP